MKIGFVKGNREKQSPNHQEKTCYGRKKPQRENRPTPHKATVPLGYEAPNGADGKKQCSQSEEAVEEPVFQQYTVDIIHDVKNKCQTGADQENHIPPAFKIVWLYYT